MITYFTKKLRNQKGFIQHHSKKAGARFVHAPKNGAGFTLIELLVVIAIIGVLASIVLASLNTARRKSRDTRRIADMNQVKLANELYFDTWREYWETTSVNTLAPTFISVFPSDPLNSGSHVYTYDPLETSRADDAGVAVNTCATGETCLFFHVGATVEDNSIAAITSRAGRCPGAAVAAGCVASGSLDDTTVYGRQRNHCTDAAVAEGADGGVGCYDVSP